MDQGRMAVRRLGAMRMKMGHMGRKGGGGASVL